MHSNKAKHPTHAGAEGARGMLRMIQAKGAGYALSREEELTATMDVAQATGVWKKRCSYASKKAVSHIAHHYHMTEFSP